MTNKNKLFKKEATKQKTELQANAQTELPQSFDKQSPHQSASFKQKNACFICSEENHKQASCPYRFKQTLNSNGKKASFQKPSKRSGLIKTKKRYALSKYEIVVLVNSRHCVGYRDTGSAMSFIRADLFPEVEISGKIEIFGINDKDPVSVPTALVKMSSPKFGTHDTIDVEVGILEHMKWEILLGNEIFEGTDLTDVICVEGPRSGNDRRTTSVDNVAAENSDTVPLSDMTADSDVTYGRDRQAGTTAADSGSELT